MVKSILSDSFKINKQILIKGNKFLNFSFYSYMVLIWILIICWVIYNNGYIKTDNYMLSTVNLQTFESIKTNYSKQEFNLSLIKESEFDNYNRVWDRTDFVDYYPNEIHFMTNMVITANQTRTICPDFSLEDNFICDPNNNHCQKGHRTQNGIHTGNCIEGDYPLGAHHNSACEMEGWCPVGGMLMPLVNEKPVLIETINSTLNIYNSIEFPNENIIINNLIEDVDVCKYDAQTHPDCPSFKLGYIIGRIPNANFTYESLASYGGSIMIKIEWNCNLPLIGKFDCRPEYSFRRVDEFSQTAYSIYYLKANYDQYGYSRQLIRAQKIRFQVQVTGSLSKFDIFSFVTTCSAYFGVSSLMVGAFVFYVRFKYGNIISADKINVGNYQEDTGDNELSTQEILSQENEENIPLNPTSPTYRTIDH